MQDGKCLGGRFLPELFPYIGIKTANIAGCTKQLRLRRFMPVSKEGSRDKSSGDKEQEFFQINVFLNKDVHFKLTLLGERC